jgi:deazaflavin-dependent oxidoreductase (nitroreductase family)
LQTLADGSFQAELTPRRSVNHQNPVMPPHPDCGKTPGERGRREIQGEQGTAGDSRRILRQSAFPAGVRVDEQRQRLRELPLNRRQEPDMSDWNNQTITEFRANEGKVGGAFEGAPMVLVHHRGRKSGREYVTPTMYLAHETDPVTIYVFATKGGAPTNPEWYVNLVAAGDATIERGTETYDVTVREVAGPDRDSIYSEQAHRYPGFAEYERQTAGIRTIPVLELRRS